MFLTILNNRDRNGAVQFGRQRILAMHLYQHDGPKVFQFVLEGELAGDDAVQLEHAWNTAQSILEGKELVVDISGITNADAAGMEALSRLRDSGARVIDSRVPYVPPAVAFCRRFFEGRTKNTGGTDRSPAAPASAAARKLRSRWPWRLLRLAGIVG